MLIVVGYACLGLLVGTLVGLTSSAITTTILASIFTLAGGSIIPLLGRPDTERRTLGAILSGFAFFCLLGVLGGIYLKVNRKLDLPSATGNVVYLQKLDLTTLNRINVQYRNKDITAEQAYGQLWDEIQRESSQGEK
jgi:hypothetical protein